MPSESHGDLTNVKGFEGRVIAQISNGTKYGDSFFDRSAFKGISFGKAWETAFATNPESWQVLFIAERQQKHAVTISQHLPIIDHDARQGLSDRYGLNDTIGELQERGSHRSNPRSHFHRCGES
jgi:hypothetical protein